MKSLFKCLLTAAFIFAPLPKINAAGWLLLVKSSAPTTTTFDATFASGANVTLSNGNLTVTGTSSANNLIRSVANHTSGKYYCEFTVGTTGGSVGVGSTDVDAVNTDYVGSNGLNSTGNFGSWAPATGTTTSPSIMNAHTYGLAVDVDNHAMWLIDITAAGTWNANGTANPATNTNGAIYSYSKPAVYAAVTASGTGNGLTFNFGASAYTGTPPAGFSNW